MLGVPGEECVWGGVTGCVLFLLGALMGKEAGYPGWCADFHSVHFLKVAPCFLSLPPSAVSESESECLV